jgi:hypothetical protein
MVLLLRGQRLANACQHLRALLRALEQCFDPRLVPRSTNVDAHLHAASRVGSAPQGPTQHKDGSGARSEHGVYRKRTTTYIWVWTYASDTCSCILFSTRTVRDRTRLQIVSMSTRYVWLGTQRSHIQRASLATGLLHSPIPWIRRPSCCPRWPPWTSVLPLSNAIEDGDHECVL